MRNILTFIIAILPFIGYFWGKRNGKQALINKQNAIIVKDNNNTNKVENAIENYNNDELHNFIDGLQKENRDG